MKRAISAFYEDVEGHFVAILACGHEQHVRHRPPFIERPWVLTEGGRQAKIGVEVECIHCARELADEGDARADAGVVTDEPGEAGAG